MVTPRLLLPELTSGQSNKFATHNEALMWLDMLTQTSVIDKDLATPPGSPANGDMYIIASGGTGAWSGKDDQLTYYHTATATWKFFDPFEGVAAWVRDEDKQYTFDGAAWVSTGLGDLDSLTDVVITAAAAGDMLRYNGSSWVNEKPPYDVGVSRIPGIPIASQIMMEIVFVRTVVFPAALSGSVGNAIVAATSQTDFDIQKNTSSVGTMRFAASATTPSFIAASPFTMNSGDNLRILAPGSPDATLADIVFTLKGTRS